MSLWIGTLASAGKKIRDFLFGTNSGKLYIVNNKNEVTQVPGFSLGAIPNTSSTGKTWQTISIMPQISDIAFNGEIFVAVGGETIMTSTDAITWISRTSNITGGFLSTVAYGNGLWLAGGAVSNVSALRQSTDGITWSVRNFNNPSGFITHLNYDNNIWIMTQGSTSAVGTLSTSTDATTWTSRISTPSTSQTWRSVNYGNNVWIASSASFGDARRSTDSITWTTVTTGLNSQQTNAYGNGIWVIFTNNVFSTSTNSTTWTSASTGLSISINSMIYNNNLFIASGTSGTILISTNGTTWTSTSSGLISTQPTSIAYGNNKWVVLGQGEGAVSDQLYDNFGVNDLYYNGIDKNYFAAADYGNLFRSTDLTTWTTINIGGTNNYSSIAYGNGIYYAGGQ